MLLHCIGEMNTILPTDSPSPGLAMMGMERLQKTEVLDEKSGHFQQSLR